MCQKMRIWARDILNFHPNIHLILKILVVNITVLTFFRIIFFVVYFSFFNEASFLQIVLSFLNGLRFDLSTIFQMYSLMFLIMLFPFKWMVSKPAYRIYRLIVAGLLSMAFLGFSGLVKL